MYFPDVFVMDGYTLSFYESVFYFSLFKLIFNKIRTLAIIII